MPWIFYAILTPALYAITNYIDKFLLEKKVKNPLVTPLYGGILCFFWGVLILLISGFKIPQTKELLLILAAGITLQLYLLPYYKALSKDETSRVVPLFQFAPVFVLIMSSIFLKEIITPKQMLGFFFIVFGGFVLASKKIGAGVFSPRPSFWYMILASFLYALILVLFRFVVQTQGFWLTLSYEYIGIGLGTGILLFWPSLRKSFKEESKKIIEEAWGLFILNNLLSTSAQVSESYALSLAPAALVAVIGGIQPFFVLLFGLILSVWFPRIIKEEISRSAIGLKTITIFLIFLGLYLIYL